MLSVFRADQVADSDSESVDDALLASATIEVCFFVTGSGCRCQFALLGGCCDSIGQGGGRGCALVGCVI